TDMMKGRPAVYATFSSYDEVAHHSGLERSDTMEALRKLDQQFGRIDRARRYAPRPYELVVLSDHGQTQGATFKQRNGYDLEQLGWLMVQSSDGPLVLGPSGTRRLETGLVEGDDPLAGFSPTAPQHLLRASGFTHAPDILVGSFYSAATEEGCAFEELISFHGGIGGPQTRPFLLYPAGLPEPVEPIVG